MKTKFRSDEIAHTWAHQLAPRGTCDQSKSFDGVSFYSYAAEIGRIITRNKHKAYLVCTTSFSNTTSKHQNDMRRAIPQGATVFRFNGDLSGATGPALINYCLQEAAASSVKAEKAVSRKDFHLAEQAEWLTEAQAVNEFFNLKRKIDTAAVERLKVQIANEQKRQAKLAKERQAKLEKENAEYVQHWLAGEMVHFPSAISRVCLRLINLDGEGARVSEGGLPHVETSRGVRIPKEDAERAFRFAVARRQKGWRRNGETFQVGSYQLDAVNEEGIVAGCHRITWDEIERFAASQGWNQ